MNTIPVKQYLDKQKVKVVDTYDFDKKKVKYSEKIKGWKIKKFKGDEERAFKYAWGAVKNSYKKGKSGKWIKKE